MSVGTFGLGILRGTFREAYTVEISDLYPRLLQRVLDDGVYPFPVMSRSILGQESLPWRCDVRVSDVRQDGSRSVGVMFDDPRAKFIG